QREDAAAGPADVAEQQLEDGRGADVLRADRVLRPADAVDEGRGPFGSRVLRQQLADPRESLRRYPAGLLDHVRGVAGEVPLQHLEHASRMLQRLVAVRVAVRRSAAGAVRLAAAGLADLALRGPVVLLRVSGFSGLSGPVPVPGRRGHV